MRLAGGAGVVDEYVDATEPSERALHRRRGLVRIGEVA
jgi:hypothetical protein